MVRLKTIVAVILIACAAYYLLLPAGSPNPTPVAHNSDTGKSARQTPFPTAHPKRTFPVFTPGALKYLDSPAMPFDLPVAEQVPQEITSPRDEISALVLAATAIAPTSTPIPPQIKTIATNATKVNEGELAIAALKELDQGVADEDGRIFGARVRSASSNIDVEPAPEPTTLASPSPTAFARINAQARGFTILSLMHKRARESVDRQVETLLKADIGNIYLGVLVDGTFGKDYPYLKQVLSRLTQGRRSVLLVLYLSNGATMRSQNSPIDTGFNDIRPDIFRELIKHDRPIRWRFEEICREAKEAFDYNTSLSPNNKNIAIVMLEDNLDQESYSAMRSLASPIFGDSVEFVRNPCPGCYQGNDTFSFDDKIESHSLAEASQLSEGDGFSLDGTGYFYEGEAPALTQTMSIEATKQLLLQVKGIRYVGLWRAARQGLDTVSNLVHPDERIYEVPTDAEMQVDIDLLRYGLD